MGSASSRQLHVVNRKESFILEMKLLRSKAKDVLESSQTLKKLYLQLNLLCSNGKNESMKKISQSFVNAFSIIANSSNAILFDLNHLLTEVQDSKKLEFDIACIKKQNINQRIDTIIHDYASFRKANIENLGEVESTFSNYISSLGEVTATLSENTQDYNMTQTSYISQSTLTDSNEKNVRSVVLAIKKFILEDINCSSSWDFV